MSLTLTITGNNSNLKSYFQPPLKVDESWECGLLFFSAMNSISNINSYNNKFIYGDEEDTLEIPCGTYDLYDLQYFLENNIKNCDIDIKPNMNTLKCSIYCSKIIHFDKNNSIGGILGFSSSKLEANKWHESQHNVNILPLSVIRIECDIVQGSYINGTPAHILHEFVPNVPPAYRYIEVPQNIIYLPLNRNNITSINIKIVDECEKCIDFGQESIQLRIHLRKRK